MNIERYRMVMWRIWADLRGWNQSWCHSDRDGMPAALDGCATAHCVAGWCVVLANRSTMGDTMHFAQDWLELNHDECGWLFSTQRTLADLNGVLRRGSVFE